MIDEIRSALLQECFERTKEMLAVDSTAVTSENKLNRSNRAIMAESFYGGILNILYDYKLIDLNCIQRNYPGIDLGDEENRIAFQITSNGKKKKIWDTWNSTKTEDKNKYTRIIVFRILPHKDCAEFNAKDDDKLNGIKLEHPGFDVWDLDTLFGEIQGKLLRNESRITRLYGFIQRWKGVKTFDQGAEKTFEELFSLLYVKSWMKYRDDFCVNDEPRFRKGFVGNIDKVNWLIKECYSDLIMFDGFAREAICMLNDVWSGFYDILKRYYYDDDMGSGYCHLKSRGDFFESYSPSERDVQMFLDTTQSIPDQKYKHIKYLSKAAFFELTKIVNWIQDKKLEENCFQIQLNLFFPTENDRRDGFVAYQPETPFREWAGAEDFFLMGVNPERGHLEYQRSEDTFRIWNALENYVMRMVNPVSFFLLSALWRNRAQHSGGILKTMSSPPNFVEWVFKTRYATEMYEKGPAIEGKFLYAIYKSLTAYVNKNHKQFVVSLEPPLLEGSSDVSSLGSWKKYTFHIFIPAPASSCSPKDKLLKDIFDAFLVSDFFVWRGIWIFAFGFPSVGTGTTTPGQWDPFPEFKLESSFVDVVEATCNKLESLDFEAIDPVFRKTFLSLKDILNDFHELISQYYRVRDPIGNELRYCSLRDSVEPVYVKLLTASLYYELLWMREDILKICKENKKDDLVSCCPFPPDGLGVRGPQYTCDRRHFMPFFMLPEYQVPYPGLSFYDNYVKDFLRQKAQHPEM